MNTQININKQDKLNILYMIYTDIVELTDGIWYCSDENISVVVDINGNEIINDTIQNLHLADRFVIHITENNKIFTVINFDTNAILNLSNDKDTIIYKIVGIGNSFLAVEYYNRTVIYDKNLRILHVLYHCENFVVQGETDTGYYVSYRMDYKPCNAFFNKFTNKIEYFDSVKLTESLHLVAVDISDTDGITCNKGTFTKFRYKLGDIKNTIISNKNYEDILNPTNIKTDVLYTLDINPNKTFNMVDSKGNSFTIKSSNLDRKLGIMLHNGTEVLPALADDIEYIGSDNFLITVDSEYKKQRFIVNTEKGVIIRPDESSNIYIHDTLPLTLIHYNNSCKALDVYGRMFDIEQLPKYFSCSYCKNKPDIIQVTLDFSVKYITNKLVPITNMHEVMKLRYEEWVPM